jgi:glutamate dehydrogenase
MLAKDELLDRVVDRVREQMPDDRAAQAEEFARQYFAWIPREDLDGRSPIDLYGAAMSHFGFAYQRSPGEAKVRVYNPQFEEHGWQSTHTALEVVTDDMPFLVDSTRMEVNTRGYSIHLMLHPIMKVRRDDEGRLLEILPADADDEDAVSESVIHVEVDRQTEPEVLEEVGACTERVLSQVRAAVEDWPAMLERVGEILSAFDEDPPPLDRKSVV